jgi:hypothetical protein
MQYNQPYGMPAEVTWGDTPYINGNPSTGTAGSIPPAGSIEYPQREIVNVIRDAALLTPSNSDLHQLAKSIQSGLLWSDDDAGTVNQYQVTQTPAPTAYFKYMTVVTKIANTNTGASTLNVNALGPKNIVHVDGSILTAAELKANSVVCFIYDGTNFQMVWSSTVGGGGGSGGPIYLLAPKTFYVNYATGDDTNYDGSAATFTAPNHGPYKTLQRASNEINKYNLNGYSVQVNVADNTGYPYWTIPSPNGNGSVTWQGNNSNPGNVIVTGVNHSACIGAFCGMQFINGFMLTSSGSVSGGDNLCGFNMSYNCRIQCSYMNFAACSGPHIYVAGSGSNFVPRGPIYISGGSPGNSLTGGAHIFGNAITNVAVNGLDQPTLTFTTSVSYQYFIAAIRGSMCAIYYSSIANPSYGNGTKYTSQMNSVIDSGGGGVNYYPGNLAGTTASGGQYV